MLFAFCSELMTALKVVNKQGEELLCYDIGYSVRRLASLNKGSGYEQILQSALSSDKKAFWKQIFYMTGHGLRTDVAFICKCLVLAMIQFSVILLCLNNSILCLDQRIYYSSILTEITVE